MFKVKAALDLQEFVQKLISKNKIHDSNLGTNDIGKSFRKNSVTIVSGEYLNATKIA